MMLGVSLQSNEAGASVSSLTNAEAEDIWASFYSFKEVDSSFLRYVMGSDVNLSKSELDLSPVYVSTNSSVSMSA